jgi:hypothetical protein
MGSFVAAPWESTVGFVVNYVWVKNISVPSQTAQ